MAKTGPKPRYESEGGGTRISLYVSADNKERLQQVAGAQDVSPSELVNALLGTYFKQIGVG